MKSTLSAWVLTVLLPVLMLAGCLRTGTIASSETATSEVKPVWPPPPDPARITYLSSIAGSRDLGVEKSLFRHLGELLAGASEEWLVRPTGVAANGGLLAIADPGTPALFLFDRAAKRFRKVTEAKDEDLVSPVAVALGDDDTVYLADSYLSRIYVYNRDGRFREAWGGGDLQRPTGLAFDAQRHRLYVADTGAHRILAYNPAGGLLFAFGESGSGDGQLNWPSQLCVDGQGLIYVVDSFNFRLQIFDADGQFQSKFGHQGDGSGDFSRPKGVGVDSHGHIYIVDALFDAVQIFARDGQFLLGFGQQGRGPGEFWLPVGLATDGEDRIYVADSYNQRIQIFQFLQDQ